MDFAIPTDHRVKSKESEKSDNYQDLARERNNLWNMSVIPIVIGTKELVQGLGNKRTSIDHPNYRIVEIS